MKLPQGLTPKFKLWLSTGSVEGVFGDGKWRLLRAIETSGSLKAAAELLKISYRKAWGDLKKAEESLGVQLVVKSHGGRQGGSAVLTPEGKDWLERYSVFRSKIEDELAKAYKEHMV